MITNRAAMVKGDRRTRRLVGAEEVGLGVGGGGDQPRSTVSRGAPGGGVERGRPGAGRVQRRGAEARARVEDAYRGERLVAVAGGEPAGGVDHDVGRREG